MLDSSGVLHPDRQLTDSGGFPVDAAALAAGLKRARELLGPEVISVVDDDADSAVLVEHAEAALPPLRERAMDSGSARAHEATMVLLELADLARLSRMHSVERRVNGVTAVQRALAELRAVGSVELMLERSTQVVCERLGFDRSTLFKVENDTVYPASAFDRRGGDDAWLGKVRHFREKLGDLILDDMLIESEMIRRRTPAIIRDAQHHPRTFKPMINASDVSSYVAAPIVPGGCVIGFLHADLHYQRREVDVIDRDLLWAFAEGYGYALERTVLRNQVRGQRRRIRELLRTADELLNEIGEADVQIEHAETESAARTAASLPAGGSRIHALLTPREIEVVELLVHGSTNKQIAERLVVTEATAKSHVTNIYRKLRAANRAEAVHRYMKLLTLDQS